MKPYYEHAGITIWLGDCREIISTLDRVDAVVADPPYGETSLAWDSQIHGWMNCCRTVTNSLWCFGSLSLFMDMIQSGECCNWTKAQDVVWEKHNGSSLLTDRFRRVHELIVQFYHGDWASVFKMPVMVPDGVSRKVIRRSKPSHWSEIKTGRYESIDGGPVLMRSVIFARSCHGYADHPTQKPEEIIIPLLEYSVPVGGTVLDPFCGSGSTLVAARNKGRNAIGIEIEERYAEIAAKRLSQEVFQF